MISWEVFFGNRARDAVQAGGQLLLNPTNGSTYTGTSVQTQQIASSRLRAIETGRWVGQVAPTGFSAFVSPDGDVQQRTATKEQAVIVDRSVPLRTGVTWYVRWGDTPARLLGVALVAIGWVLDRRGRRRADADRSRSHPGLSDASAPRSRRAASDQGAGASDLEQERDRAVVDQLDLHVGAEAAGGDRGAERAERVDEPLDERLGFGRTGRRHPRRAPAPAGVAVERELADDEQGRRRRRRPSGS